MASELEQQIYSFTKNASAILADIRWIEITFDDIIDRAMDPGDPEGLNAVLGSSEKAEHALRARFELVRDNLHSSRTGARSSVNEAIRMELRVASAGFPPIEYGEECFRTAHEFAIAVAHEVMRGLKQIHDDLEKLFSCQFSYDNYQEFHAIGHRVRGILPGIEYEILERRIWDEWQTATARLGCTTDAGCENEKPRDEAVREVPCWLNDHKRELTIGGEVIRKVKSGAPKIDLILNAFESAGWPKKIEVAPTDFPAGVDHYVRTLNTKLRRIRFHVVNTYGVQWVQVSEKLSDQVSEVSDQLS